MAEDSPEVSGSDFEKGVSVDDVPDGSLLEGHAFGESVLVSRSGEQFFAIGATCTHYGGPLGKGLRVGETVHCPWHHACFSLRTGEAIAAPALNDVSCWKVERRGDRVFVTGKVDKKPAPKPKSSPASVVIVAGGRSRRRCSGDVTPRRLRRCGHND